MDEIEKSPAEPLLEEVKPPFMKDILEAPLPVKIKMHQIKLYGGEGDPTEHLETIRSWMELQGAIGAAMCRTFSPTLIVAARKSYRKLKHGYSFTQLS